MRPRSMPLARSTMKKELHGFLDVFLRMHVVVFLQLWCSACWPFGPPELRHKSSNKCRESTLCLMWATPLELIVKISLNFPSLPPFGDRVWSWIILHLINKGSLLCGAVKFVQQLLPSDTVLLSDLAHAVWHLACSAGEIGEDVFHSVARGRTAWPNARHCSPIYVNMSSLFGDLLSITEKMTSLWLAESRPIYH